MSLVKLTNDQKDLISSYIENLRKIKIDLKEDIAKRIDEILLHLEEIKNSTEFEMEKIDSVIRELKKFSVNISEIDYIASGLEQIANELRTGENISSSLSSLSTASPVLHDEGDENVIDDVHTRNLMFQKFEHEVMDKRKLILVAANRPIYIRYKKDVYKHFHKIDNLIINYHNTGNRKQLDRIDLSLQSLKALPIIGDLAQILHSLKSASELINSFKVDTDNEYEKKDDDGNEHENVSEELHEVKRYPKFYTMFNILDGTAKNNIFVTYDSLAKYTKSSKGWATKVINELERSRLIKIDRRRIPHRIYAYEGVDIKKLAKWWRANVGRYYF